MRDTKLPQMGLELAQLLKDKREIWHFDATSHVDINYTVTILSQASQLSWESFGTCNRILWDKTPREADFISRLKNLDVAVHSICISSLGFTFRE